MGPCRPVERPWLLLHAHPEDREVGRPQALGSPSVPVHLLLMPSINIPEVVTWAVNGSDPKMAWGCPRNACSLAPSGYMGSVTTASPVTSPGKTLKRNLSYEQRLFSLPDTLQGFEADLWATGMPSIQASQSLALRLWGDSRWQ